MSGEQDEQQGHPVSLQEGSEVSERTPILLTISDLSGGGAEREFVNIVSALPGERYDRHVILWRPSAVYTLPWDVTVHMLHKSKPWHTPRLIRETAGIIDAVRPEIIFSQMHFVSLVTGAALVLARWTDFRWVARFVNDPRRDMPWPISVSVRWALRRADVVLGASRGVASALRRTLRIDASRVSWIDNMVDLHAIRQQGAPLPGLRARTKGKRVFVAAGRLTSQKNFPLLLKAFAMQEINTELWILGSGRLERRLRRLASRLVIEDRVRWLGFQENPYSYFAAADCFVLSSNHEGSPNVLIEAMALGLPVISTDCPFGPQELIDNGVTGLLTPVNDVAALADAMRFVIDNPLTARRLGATAREAIAERFEWGLIGSRYEAVLQGD